MATRDWGWRILAGLLLAAASQPAGATPVCGGSTFTTCASVNVTKILLSNGNVRVRIEVMNQAGLGGTFAGAQFTRIGLWGLPESARYVDSSLVAGGNAVATDWRLSTRTKEDGDEDEISLRKDVRGVRVRPGVVTALRPGQSASFEFDLSGVSIEDVDVQDWLIHAEVGSGDCSTDMVAKKGTLNEARNEQALCSAVLTPEPASIILLVTGLLGLGGVAWQRPRRRR